MRTFRTSEKDVELLRRIDQLGVVPSELDDFDFSETVVVKPWGYEYMAFESDDRSICAWVLHMRNDGIGTSLHCHRGKSTRIVVLAGGIRIRTIDATDTLCTGEEAFFAQGAFHALEGLSEPCIVVEIESPSNKVDAVRWTDHWGRERQQYESQCELLTAMDLPCPYRTDPQLHGHVRDLALETQRSFAIAMTRSHCGRPTV